MAAKNNLTIAEGRVAALYYVVKDPEGRELDSNKTRGHKPLVLLFGAGNVVKGLEKLIEGKRKNDFVSGEVAPADAYGERSDALVETLDRSTIPVEAELVTGMLLSGTDRNGKPRTAVVTAIEGDQVTLDSNHPMAGKTLTFEVTIAGVREATAEELEHGHVHGPGGHKH